MKREFVVIRGSVVIERYATRAEADNRARREAQTNGELHEVMETLASFKVGIIEDKVVLEPQHRGYDPRECAGIYQAGTK